MKDIGIQNPFPNIGGDRPDNGPDKTPGTSSFKDQLQKAIQDVDQVQKEADQAAKTLAVGQTENIHETMIALEKAELSFKMMMQIRNKIVKAYEEVMRMQV